MPYVALTFDELSLAEIPAKAQHLMDQHQWHKVHEAWQLSRGDSAGKTCLASLMLCGACCCSERVEFAMMLGVLPERLRLVNREVFWDKPVLQVRNGAVVFETDYILERRAGGGVELQHNESHKTPHQHHHHHHQQLPQDEPIPEVEAVPIDDIYPPAPPSPPSSHHHHQQQVRKMDVIVPAGAPPGSVLSVQDPHGQIVQVTVPDGVTAGMKLEFQY